MSISDAFEFASKNTHILRERKNTLYTFGSTRLPYIFCAESTINEGDTVVRKGEINVDKPQIILPGQEASFEGFEFETESGETVSGEELRMIFMARGVSFPNMRYKNSGMDIRVVEEQKEQVLDKYQKYLEQEHDTRTGLLAGPDEFWTVSLMLYAGNQIARSGPDNLKEIIERMELS